MELETRIKDGCVHTLGECVDEDAVELWQAEMLVHDAMRAHALMQAIRREAPGVYGRVMERADELMVDWGFDSAEVE
jgi:hypothetical protein